MKLNSTDKLVIAVLVIVAILITSLALYSLKNPPVESTHGAYPVCAVYSKIGCAVWTVRTY